jgi:Poly(R)-hydroxyalkanoic acid synthase subunit (PHA_synth_III_E)
MADENYLKMMTDFWESASKTASDSQRNLMQTLATGIGTSFPVLFTPFLAGHATSTKASETLRRLLDSLMAVPDAMANATGQTTADAKTAALLQKIMNPQEWLAVSDYTDNAVRQFVEGPRYADIGQIEQKFAALVTAWNDLRMRSMEQSTYQLNAYAKAAQEFTSTLAEAAKDKPIESRSHLVAMWVDIANKHLFEANRTPEFLTTQRDLLRASTAFKRAQRELGDYYGELFGIPTRGEIDDLTRTVAELKRQFRAEQRRRKQGDARPVNGENAHGAL